MLIAIDEYNTWFQDTIFGYDGKPVKPSDISVIDAFLDIDAEGYKMSRRVQNGLFIGAFTEQYPSKSKIKDMIDYRKLRKTYRTYTTKELQDVLQYYRQVQFLVGTYNDACTSYKLFSQPSFTYR